MRRTVLVVFLTALLLVGVALATEAKPLRLGLDFFPNPNHVPVYLAQSSGHFGDRGLDIEVVVPANPSDPVKLAASGWLDVALTPQINYLIARSEGLPLIAIGALIDSNLGGLLSVSESDVQTLSDLAGRRIGYSLAPLEPVLWETMLACAGVGFDEIELVNVGFSTMPALLTGSVDAIGAFRNYEPIQVEMQGFEPVFFPQEIACIPQTYDIILVAHPDRVVERRGDLMSLLAALDDAVRRTQSNPDEALASFLEAHPELDDEVNRRSFDLTVPLFADGLRHDDATVWREMQDYLFMNGLIGQTFEHSSLYTAELLPDTERGENP